MEEIDKLKGYQKLEQDFFRLCSIRKIKLGSMLVFIYLRGLYCRFGKAIFYHSDKKISKDLGISCRQIIRIKKLLQEHGLIEFKAYKGRGKITQYSILKTELAPDLKGDKMSLYSCQNVTIPVTKCHYTYKSKEKSKEQSKVVVSQPPKNFIPVNRDQMHKDTIKFLSKKVVL